MTEPTPRRDLLAAVDAPVLTALAVHADRLGVRLFLVGGPVRDLLSGRAPSDLDIASSATPGRFRELLGGFRFPGAHLSVFDVGEAHGTTGVHVVADATVSDIEHTTFRAERYSTGSRAPEVTHVEDLVEDLARRDFTVNAMALDLVDGSLWDPFGGTGDLRTRRLRCPSDPLRTFTEDPLRVSRMVRFAAVRELAPDRSTRTAAQLARHVMSQLSAERVAGELERIVTAGPDALARAATLCAQLELGPQVLGVDNPEPVAAAAERLHTAAELRALLAVASGDPAAHLARLRSTRAATRSTLAATALLDADTGALPHAVRRAGADTAQVAAQVAAALGHRHADALAELAGLTDLFVPLGIDGNDLAAAGLSGRDVGRALDAATAALVTAVRDRRPVPGRDELLAAALDR